MHGDDARSAAHPSRQRESGADGRHPALHAVAVEMPEGEVLAAADAAAHAGLAAHDLGDEPVELARVGQEMPVIPMIRQHHIVGIVERAHDRHLAELLAEAGVRGARDRPLAEQLEQQLLGAPNQIAERYKSSADASDDWPAGRDLAGSRGSGER